MKHFPLYKVDREMKRHVFAHKTCQSSMDFLFYTNKKLFFRNLTNVPPILITWSKQNRKQPIRVFQNSNYFCCLSWKIMFANCFPFFLLQISSVTFVIVRVGLIKHTAKQKRRVFLCGPAASHGHSQVNRTELAAGKPTVCVEQHMSFKYQINN